LLEHTYDINQKIQGTLPLLDKLRRIMGLPLLLLIFAKVSSERLLTPRAVDRVGNWGKGGARLVLAGVLEELW
jgi:hypothetical protein